MRICLYSIISLLLISCSSQTKNMISSGDLVLKGGVFKTQKWSDPLTFERKSWYKEFTLLFDVLYQKIDLQSPFAQWYSESEKESINSCSEALLVVSYHLDAKRISYSMFKEQMSKAGYEEFALEEFGQNLKLHPDYEYLSLSLHKVHGFCRKGTSLDSDLRISFPGFNEVVLH
ncbi:MAG: hypothetical protein COW00_08990 [Bdellovibrio sp. CG12_big_fil_rev_8_21_14_0_65_39_13]|nr:MAG: hypothetical protein COW78_09060 [Bdellovibrio sp. CG22_combo_CG10-13_8_21_14_all_39_27]PIQ59760.1 MAG: hypothetical protein COW00_08990 [Bdellovibrio sp. CG12_big_fil_rev_8_21_14_0_65_39_13]PIR36210.1 MAG: hypothetical protein COV37_04395 [Bdellovibrio sp. CG11_big_fil_rev_8_21_14_0_20_39_38]PJB54382.1 MAG: hypothetical protein CO099_01895 [Bdellovibrio sp. CG_4_9_14_3_um_filter_39_7]